MNESSESVSGSTSQAIRRSAATIVDDDSAVELPQRPLPRVSILWLIGLITVSAFLFTMFKAAGDGYRWAQLLTLLVGMAAGTLVAYATIFLLGMFLDGTVGRLRRPRFGRDGTDHRTSLTDRSTLMMAIASASLFAGVADETRAAQTKWVGGSYPAGRVISDFSLIVGVESSPGPGGYRTLHLSFRPTRRTFSRDHRLTVRVSSHSRFKPRLAAETSQSFTLPQGAATANRRMLVPLFGQSESFKLHAFEDGRRVGEDPLVLPLGSSLDDKYAGQQLTIAVFDPAKIDPRLVFPDVRGMVTILGSNPTSRAPLPEAVKTTRLTHQDAIALVEQQVQPAWVQFRLLDPTTPPTNWLSYSDLDVIVVHDRAWQAIEKRPAALRAVKQWVATGGNLWLYGESPSPDALADSINPGVDFEPLPPKVVPDPGALKRRLTLHEDNDTSALMDQHWLGSVVKQSTTYGMANAFRKRQEIYDELTEVGHPILDTEDAASLSARVQTSDYGLGKIVKIEDPDPFPGSLQLWAALQDFSFAENGISWFDRMGLNYQAGDTNYWRWLIESVGGPPVKSFLTLNTLFVLMVGPISYFFLRRHDRLYMLYFAAPALALMVSSGLFGFAMLSDGLGTKLRPQQWTWIDHEHDVVVRQDRSTFYSAFGSGELRFAVDAFVMPVLPQSSVERGTYGGDRIYPGGRIRWTGEEQIWSGDFLPTRSQVQYLVTRPVVEAKPPLSFELPDDSRSPVRITNHSLQTIGPLMYRDNQGNYHRIETVSSGQSMPMTSASGKELATIIDQRVLPKLDFLPNVRSGWNMYYNSIAPGDERPRIEAFAEQWRRGLPTGSFVGLGELDPRRFAMEDVQVGEGVQVLLGLSR